MTEDTDFYICIFNHNLIFVRLGCLSLICTESHSVRHECSNRSIITLLFYLYTLMLKLNICKTWVKLLSKSNFCKTRMLKIWFLSNLNARIEMISNFHVLCSHWIPNKHWFLWLRCSNIMSHILIFVRLGCSIWKFV